MADGTSERMVDAALRYATEYGIAVFPLHTPDELGECDCRLPHCPNNGKHPWTEHGVNEATKDPVKIQQWWTRWPKANIGAATGEISGIVVLDPDDGSLGWAEVEALYPNGVNVPSVKTGNGRHLYYRHPGWRTKNRVKNYGGWPFKHCDFRGDGGYVILPPSTHFSGVQYEWMDATTPSDIPAMPDWLQEAVQATKQTEGKEDKQAGNSAPGKDVPEQVWRDAAESALLKYINLVSEPDAPRNQIGFDLACQLRDARVPRKDAATYMRDYQIFAEDLADGKAPYTWDEANKSLQSAYDQAPRDPAFDAAKGGHGPPLGGVGTWSAGEFIKSFGADLRYVAVHKRWYLWNGMYWEHARKEEAMQFGQLTVKSLYKIASAIDDDDARKKFLGRLAKLDSANGISGMVTLARTWQPIASVPEQFDNDPLKASAANGVINLTDGTLIPHSREQMNTKRLGPASGEKIYAVPYDPDAECPNWLDFLYTVLEGREEDIAFLKRAFGYTLTGKTGEHSWFLLTGSGRNGKSTVIRALKDILGTYGDTVPVETLLASQNDHIPAEIAKLDGIRLAVTGENEQGKRLAEALIKRITHGDDISARFLYGQPFTFTPQFKLWMHTNFKPKIRGQDLGTWRGIKPIPFNYRIPEEQLDKDFYEKYLEPELPGILAWAVQGAIEYMKFKTLGEPAAILEAIKEYREESDVTAEYLAENIVKDPGVYVVVKDIYEHYVRWCKLRGDRPDSSQLFGRRVAETYDTPSESKRVNGAVARVYMGVRVNDFSVDYYKREA